MSGLLEKVSYYLSSTNVFGVLTAYHQIIFALCPAIFRYLSTKGWLIFFILLIFSLVHYRFFHIFFVLMLLQAKLPDETDKSFWRDIGLYLIVLALWGVLNFHNATEWMKNE
jgi:hypothetical protein